MGSPGVSMLIMGLVRMLVQCDTQCTRIPDFKPSSRNLAQNSLNFINCLTARAKMANLTLFSLATGLCLPLLSLFVLVIAQYAYTSIVLCSGTHAEWDYAKHHHFSRLCTVGTWFLQIFMTIYVSNHVKYFFWFYFHSSVSNCRRVLNKRRGTNFHWKLITVGS